MAKLSIDPIILEVVQNALSSIADELASCDNALRSRIL